MNKINVISNTIQNIKNTADADQFSRRCFNALRTKEINRSDYYNLFNQLDHKIRQYGILSENDRRSIINRVDKASGRKLGEFALGIYDNTLRERILIEAWKDRLIKSGNVEKIDISDYGMANDGMIYFSKQNINPKADFKITVSGSKIEKIPNKEMFIEVKFCPSQQYLHFKKGDFECYAKDNVNILIFIGNDQMFGGNGNPKWDMQVSDFKLEEWGLITNNSIHDILNKEVFTERHNARGQLMMGGKDCVRLNRNNQSPRITDYVELYKW